MSVPSNAPGSEPPAPPDLTWPDIRESAIDEFGSDDGAAVRDRAPGVPGGRSSLGAALLAVLVVVQAGPTALWVSGQMNPAAAAAVPVPPPPAPPMVAPAPPMAAAATAPCEPPAPPAPPVPAAAIARSAPAAPPRPAGVLAGLVAVDAPLTMDVYSRGRLVGTTAMERLMLPLGTHDLEFVNDEVGYRTTRSVTVQAGAPSIVRVEVPRAPVHVNATPWAEVWIDGERIGETPLGNIQQPLGRRDIVFRHPELGERRVPVLVTLKQPARVSVDLRQPN